MRETRDVQRVAFKFAWARLYLATVAFGFGCVPLGLTFAPSHGPWYVEGGQRLLGLALFALGLRLAVGCARMGIFWDNTGVLIRNVFSEQAVPWVDIASFGSPAEYGAMRKAGLRVTLLDGSDLFATAVSRGRLDGPKGSDAVVEFLNHRLRLATSRNPERSAP